MQYYINVTSWNLLESFVTESLSPFAFYQSRSFGNKLSRYLDVSHEITNYLILSAKDRGGDYVVRVDETLLDASCVSSVKKSKTLFTYSKTIYYRKGYVAFRFSSEGLRDNLVAESKILFEVKCVEKYASDFCVKAMKEATDKFKGDNPFSFQQQEFIEHDNIYNKVKGAVVAYARGIASSVSGDMQALIVRVKDLKNAFAGLNTSIMVNECSVADAGSFIKSIKGSKELYIRTTARKTNLFDILEQQFYEVVKLAALREKEISTFGSSSNNSRKESLKREEEKLEEKLFKIEAETRLSDIMRELDDIKAAEKRIGEQNGKSRIYFKKGTDEYERKKFLKSEIQRFEESHEEYRDIKRKISEIKQQISELNNAPIKYDAALASNFIRISDITNDLLRNLNINSKPSHDIDFSALEMNETPYVRLYITTCSKAELDFFNVVLRIILCSEYKNVSEANILDLITASAKAFKLFPSANTDAGEQMLATLRMYWNYKHNRVMGFDIPKDLPVFRSMMAFFIKPFGFDQMERFMQNKGIGSKQYAFMLWGAYVGYAALPKTFTDSLYQNMLGYHCLDDVLTNIHNKIECLTK